jgi:hypothetical protein
MSVEGYDPEEDGVSTRLFAEEAVTARGGASLKQHHRIAIQFRRPFPDSSCARPAFGPWREARLKQKKKKIWRCTFEEGRRHLLD